jgi:signal transduction histidine kinase
MRPDARHRAGGADGAGAAAAQDVLAGGGEMGALMRSIDWASTPVGPPERWPQSLRTVLSILLSSQHPIFMWWGPELVQFYNDGYRPILGATKHPAAMGGRGRETWREIWPVIEPMIATVFAGGSTYVRDGLLILERNGFAEECYFNYAYSPIRDERGEVGGVFVACSESTDKVLGERRLKVLGALGASAVGATSREVASAAAAGVLAEARADVPFALVYLLDEGGRSARLTGLAGLEPGHPAAPAQVPLAGPGAPWPLAGARRVEVEVDLRALPGAFPGGPWPEPAVRARVLPLLRPGQEAPFGFLVCGLGPRLPDDEPYRQFLRLAAGHVTTALSNAEAEEAKRAAHEERARLLREGEAGRRRLLNLFHNAPAFVTTLRGPDHVFEMANPLYLQLVGARREVVGLPVREALPEVAGQGFFELLDRVYRTGEPFIGRELSVQLDRHGTGHPEDVFVDFVYQPRRSPFGEVEGIDVFGFEVTQGVQARQRVEALAAQLAEAEREQARLLAAIADQPLLGVALLRGPGLVFELANAPYRQLVGGRDVVGKPVAEALPELAGQGIYALLARVLETGEPHVGRELHMRIDRRGRGAEDAWFNFVYQAVRGASGDNDGVLVLAHDVTDEVRSRGEALRQQQERLGFEQQLIGIVSHDLRNPLAAIRLSAQTLLRGEELDARNTRAALRVQASTERALRLVRDLLDFTRARVGSGIPVERRPLDFHALVRGVVEELEAAYPEREVRLEQSGDGQGAWDEDRMVQVVENLVSNAFKYSPPDTPVRVTTRTGHDGVLLEVHNAGTPIDPELVPRIFEPMQRAVAGVDAQARSVGLGLYIVKHLVEAHGGAIEVRSAEQEGTTFRVRLPR